MSCYNGSLVCEVGHRPILAGTLFIAGAGRRQCLFIQHIASAHTFKQVIPRHFRSAVISTCRGSGVMDPLYPYVNFNYARNALGRIINETKLVWSIGARRCK